MWLPRENKRKGDKLPEFDFAVEAGRGRPGVDDGLLVELSVVLLVGDGVLSTKRKQIRPCSSTPSNP